MIERKSYYELIRGNYFCYAKLAFQRVIHELEVLSSHVPIAPDSQFQGIFAQRHKKRKDFLLTKMVLDYYKTRKPEISEENRVYIALLEDQFLQDRKKIKFKEPYQFIVSVDFNLWKRYKSSFWPKPRVLPGIAKETLGKSKRFKLLRASTAPITRRERPRGYKDHGSRASEDVIARKKADREYQEIETLVLKCSQRLSVLHRTYTLHPQKVSNLFLEELREELNLPKGTSRKILADAWKRLYQRVLLERKDSIGS